MGIMDIIIVVTLTIWSVVGIMTIGAYVVYYKLMKPVAKPMVNMYRDMFDSEEDEEA
jgi:hypothetical protein